MQNKTSYPSMRNLALFALCFTASISQAQIALHVPDGYVLQALEPTGGRIAKPKDWYYSSKGTPNGWLWTFSAEEPSQNGYETGLRLQLLLGVETSTKKSRFTFAQDFLEKKRQSAAVIRECPETDQGDFKRQCLEVIENVSRPYGMKKYHILYSVFWGNKLDMVVVSTFGAPEDKWEKVKTVSEVMAAVEVIGSSFGK